jgi:predicted MFS family arabinose efflux permease
VNDRLRRKRVMVAADLARVAIVACMLLVRSREMVWLVYPLLVVETVMAAFFEPARSAVIPNIVSRRDVLAANTLASTTWSFNLAIGSTLGGLVAAALGREAVFVLNAVSFAASALLIGAMRFTEHHAEGRPPLRARDLVDYSPVLEGVAHLRSDARLLFTVMVKMGIGLLGSNWVILPVMGARLFPLSTAHLGADRAAMLSMSLLMGSRGLGALLGPLLTAPWAGRSETRLRRGILFGFIAAAIGYCLLAGAPALWTACLCVMLGHMGASSNWVFSTTLLQTLSDDRFRGRVFAADLGLCMLTISLSSYLSGLVVDWGVSVRVVAVATGCAMLLPIAAWARAQKYWMQRSAK